MSASIFYDRVKMTVSGTPGTGTITLGSAVLDGNNGDYQTFAQAGVLNGAVVRYVAIDGHNWEIGQGTYTSSGTTLTRDASPKSSSGSSAISLSSSTIIMLTASSADLTQLSTVVSLEKYAEKAGIILGSANDQVAWDLAHADMAVVANNPTTATTLMVKVPAGKYTINSVVLYNRCGFFCDPGSVTLTQNNAYVDQYVANSATPVAFVSLANAYATGFLFSGFDLYGGWSYGRTPYASNPEADPWLFQYPTTVTSNSFPDTGAHFGQMAIYINSAYSGTNDYAYTYNSGFPGFTSQLPRGHISDVNIFAFGGDAFNINGAGSQVIYNINGEQIGGRGFTCNAYDSNIYGMDFGGIGLEGFNLGPNASSMRMAAVKAWFCGTRFTTGSYIGNGYSSTMRTYFGGGQTVIGQLQDGFGVMFTVNGTASGNYNLLCDYSDNQALANDCAFLQVQGSAVLNKFELHCSAASFYNPNLNVNRLIRTSSVNGVWPSQNFYTITHNSMPDDNGTWNDFWFTGNLDNNYYNINGLTRPNGWVPNDSGVVNFTTAGTAPNNFSNSIGLSISGPNAGTPGQVVLSATGSVGGLLSQYTDTTVKDTNQLTSTQNYANGETLTIAGKTFTLQSTLTNGDGNIHIGSSEAITIGNISNAMAAINGVRGTDYSWNTVPHPYGVTATNDGAHNVYFSAPHLLNSIRNATMAGANAITGALPTYWSNNGIITGVTQAVVGTGIDLGLPYIDYKILGTNTSGTNQFLSVYMDPGANALIGQTWTYSGQYKLVGGNAISVGSLSLHTAPPGGGYLNSYSIAPFTINSSVVYQTITATIGDVGTGLIVPLSLVYYLAANASVNSVVRIYSPQLNQGTTGQPLTSETAAHASFANTIMTGGSTGTQIYSTKIGWNANGVGFNGNSPISIPVITGSRGNNAALASLISGLASYGLVSNSTTV